MSERVIVSQSDLTAIADAIRSSTGTTSTFNVPELSERAVNLIENWAGVDLPDLSNPGTAAHLLKDKQLIDEDGEIVTGNMANNGAIEMTMDGIDTKTVSIPEGYTSGGTISLDNTIDEEVEEQTDLIEQIKNAANNLPEAGGGSNELKPCVLKINDYFGISDMAVSYISSNSGALEVRAFYTDCDPINTYQNSTITIVCATDLNTVMEFDWTHNGVPIEEFTSEVLNLTTVSIYLDDSTDYHYIEIVDPLGTPLTIFENKGGLNNVY